MKFKRMWTMFKARNREFFRDRAAFGWNFVFPFLIVGGFAIIFGNEDYNEYKVGVFPQSATVVNAEKLDIPESFKTTRYITFAGFEDLDQGLDKLRHHKIDFLIKAGAPPYQYWISDSSPKGYVVERLFKVGVLPESNHGLFNKRAVQGRQIRYIEWFFPGILAMNMMFSALWGVGYVVVRYRKNGVLKRLKATPLTAFEYLSAQTLSRIFLLMFTLVVIWIGCDLVFKFTVEGSYIDLFLIFLMGGLSMTALGLLVASRGTSEEFTSGILNFITWPMMFLSEVWFSLEGAPEWLRLFAEIFPLTHMLTAARKVMNDGARLFEVGPELMILCMMTLVCLSLGAWLFRWNR
ncbi:ABC transporter permease [Thermodesulfobacteriota bacterium]